MKFSILVPSIPSRVTRFLLPLLDKLERQVGDRDVEVLVLIDNKRRSVGLKRDALVQSARGDFLAFVDDDDDVSEDYVSGIVAAVTANPKSDVIVFDQMSTINDGNPFRVRFGVEYENEEARIAEGRYVDIHRKPFHVCAWRTSIAKKHRFPDASYGEDWHWAKRALEDVRQQVRIDRVLHYYRYSDRVTEAALDFPKD